MCLLIMKSIRTTTCNCYLIFLIYRAVIDFCTYQKTVFASWKNNETSIYQNLLQQVLSIIAFPRLEIADFALDALPLLYPNIQRSEYRNIKYIQ